MPAQETHIKLFGFDELQNFFETLARKDQRKIISDSFRMSSKPLIKQARQNARQKKQTKTDKTLEKSIGFVAMRSRSKSVFISAKVGARKFKNYKGFHGHLFDAGTKSRSTKKGFDRGSMPATNFWTKAVSATEKRLSEDAADNMLAALDKLIQKNLKKQQTK